MDHALDSAYAKDKLRGGERRAWRNAAGTALSSLPSLLHSLTIECSGELEGLTQSKQNEAPKAFNALPPSLETGCETALGQIHHIIERTGQMPNGSLRSLWGLMHHHYQLAALCLLTIDSYQLTANSHANIYFESRIYIYIISH